MRVADRLGRLLLPASATAVALLLLPACSGGEEGQGGEGLTVVTSSYPLEFVVTEVAGPDVTVRNLTAAGADSHATELAPAQVASLGEADLVVHLSGMQAGVDEALQVQEPRRLLDAAPLADREGDPHFWLDPARLGTLAQQVGDVLAELEPARAQQLHEAADRLGRELDELDAEYDSALSACGGATLVTAHEAFGYLADAYGLEQVGIAGIDPHVEPSPARVRDVIEVVRDREVRTVYFEATASPGVADTLAQDLGTRTAVLHPIERVEDGQTYPELMRQNLAALQAGLTCS
jgi:zinc transport system substrate-binding protein